MSCCGDDFCGADAAQIADSDDEFDSSQKKDKDRPPPDIAIGSGDDYGAARGGGGGDDGSKSQHLFVPNDRLLDLDADSRERSFLDRLFLSSAVENDYQLQQVEPMPPPSTRSTNKATKDAGTDSDNSDMEMGNTYYKGAMIFMISGCEDSQTSADVSNVSSFQLPDPNGRAGGACTSALLNVLYADHQAVKNLTFVQVLGKMRNILREQSFSQIPQLTSSRPMSMNQRFYFVPPSYNPKMGTKRAVLIGINYIGQKGELSGCHNDVHNIKDYIMNVWGYNETDITVLMDDGYHKRPTRANILRAYQKVVSKTVAGDVVFCHYSGHGGRVRDDDGDEDDGYDETLVPLDYASEGQIRDDDLYQTLVKPMPQGSHLISIMDCCHSGTVLDLPYKYTFRNSAQQQQFESSYSKWNSGGGVLASRYCNSKSLCIAACIFLTCVIYAIVLLVTDED